MEDEKDDNPTLRSNGLLGGVCPMKRFTTSYDKPDGRYSDTIDAIDFEHAQMLCDQRGRGETVDGVLWLIVPADGRSNADADRITGALAETYSSEDEPPEADEFDR